MVLQDYYRMLQDCPALLQDWIREHLEGGKGDIKVGKGI